MLEDRLARIYASIRRGCLRSGLQPSESDDVAQDIFVWLVREGKLPLASSEPWIGWVTRNFVLRYRRRTHRENRVAGEGGLDPRPAEKATYWDAETEISVRRLEQLLSVREAAIVRHMRLGATWSEAADRAGIPAGTRHWFRRRLAGRIRGLMTGERDSNKKQKRPVV